ncbi:hypothetical protein NECHADRAFT_76534 [Paecilomyces variotii No. 5]|uniref:Major facilitator superfamily (MFS) profile domain-containing protein n=1 Tax=Byssochlamys spectabilis (strain No. 5 / NBRC 109023) TaxID=1356009 RepID=V5GE14_BYSSN|nr:hypothetical protein NECHADRAFT_76534 [Paecilomyces variotii No. 5]
MPRKQRNLDGDLSLRRRLREFTWILLFLMLYMASCAFNFGYDVGNFAGVQGMQGFAKRFGEYNPKTGVWALPAWLSSLMTSLPFIGKALGAMSCGWIAESGVLLQITATTAGQFTLGRFISFGMTGMTIVVVPVYLGEISPKSLRGMMTATLQLMIVFGQVVASLVNFGTQNITSDKGWQTSVGLQFITPFILLAFLPLVPELLSKDRLEEAKKNFRKIHKKGVTDQEINLEIEALQHANSIHGKGSWAEVFDKQNKIRATVAVIAMFGQQITGQAFQSQYSVVFFQQQGFRSQAFLFSVLGNVVGLVCLIMTLFVVDSVGRRPLLLSGGFLMGVFLFIIGGVSTVHDPNQGEKNAMVASLILYSAAYYTSWAPMSYIVVGEAPASRVKEKTNLLASVISILTTFVTSFTVPYLLSAPYATLGGKIGFIYGSICFVMVVVAWFLIPELKGRSLEEVDQLFMSGESLWKFGKVRMKPVEQIHSEEVGNNLQVRAKSEHIEE